MATQSHLEKEQKQQQGEGPTGPKNEVIAAPGDALRTGHGYAGLSVPTVSSDPSLSGGGALCGGTAGAFCCVMVDTGTISTAGEDPGPPSMPCVGESGCPKL
ncbi:hypothetical protein HJG60_003507 [Phyllostomus discolor]|uniref:Uncharacterized protein n=1 Tax=Phyllostomus discolor TaxID=89673 RepID=A0A833Z700_9CHIR|nr:hypothetical protein HJG60_003507 [Phyllostomus discolor]